ncbi:hypothetical protein Cgig2_024214 [Carnegiea gigantea]|uniref:Uncharacterized protein n=1 Tax=Carnegiea gigantea TaxID=171969 RepID=A0A9Q1JHQ4_9CARY|nr:hypothetical protein Cgig2_024214 [Carnegiea gigantea]
MEASPPTEREWEVSRSKQSGQSYIEQLGRCASVRPSGGPTQGATAKSTTASTSYTTHSRPPPMIAPPKLQNATKYCKFPGQSRHTTTECQELEDPGSSDESKSSYNPNRGMRSVRRKLWPQLLGVIRKEWPDQLGKLNSEVHSRYLSLSKDPAQRCPQ